MRRSFLSVLFLASLFVGVESCKKGDTGPAGPKGDKGDAGAPGAPGAPGAAGTAGKDGTKILSGGATPTGGAVNDYYLTTAGVLYGPKTEAGWPTTGLNLKGADGAPGPKGDKGDKGDAGAAGTNFLAGPGAPTAATGKVGDVYFNTTTSVLYKAKTAAGWTDSTAIGVTATPRIWFFDLGLGGVTGQDGVLPYNDTTLTLDPSIRINASYKLAEYDEVQRLVSYPGWGTENGREILFIDAALTTSNQDLMVPVYESDLVNTLGRRFIYTKDPANAKFMAIIRRAGFLAGLTAINTDPTVANAALPAGLVNPVGRVAGGAFAAPGSAIPTMGGSLKYGVPGVTSAAIRAQIPQAIIDLGLSSSDANPPSQFTFNADDSIQMRGVHTVPGGVTTNNPLCYWMYARIVPNGSDAAVTTGAKAGTVLDFLPSWKKGEVKTSAVVYDYNVKKTLDLNNGKFFIGSTLNKTIDGIGDAWTAARKSGSVDFKFMYGTPKAAEATGGRASQASLRNVLIAGQIAGGTIGTSATWTPGLNPGVTGAAVTSYTGAPVVTQGTSYPTMNAQNLFNTWLSLDDNGASGEPGGTIGGSAGSGPANDYSLENGAHGDVYFLTPPPYYLGTFTLYNGGRSFSYTDPMYGTYTVPAPTRSTYYPYGGVWVQNGVIQLNYWAFNGGTNLRNVTGVSNFIGTAGNPLVVSDAYSYRWTGPKGYIGPKGIAPNEATYWRTAATGGSYYDGPWPSNQNPACEGYFFSGAFRPEPAKKVDDVIIKFKIQTIPSNNPNQAPVVLKAGQQVK